MTILEHLAALAQAHGPKALADAFHALQGAVRRERKADAGGPLAQSVKAGMQIWDAQKAEGVPEPERVAGLEKTLRAAWPQTRVWHYLCDACRDTGLVMHVCGGDSTCGRTKAHLPHDFGTPCWCAKGAKFKAKAKPDPEDFAQAGRTKPTKLGR